MQQNSPSTEKKNQKGIQNTEEKGVMQSWPNMKKGYTKKEVNNWSNGVPRLYILDLPFSPFAWKMIVL